MRPNHRLPESMRMPPIVRVLYGADVALAALAVANFFVTRSLGIEAFPFFRLGQESNLPSWYSASQLLLVAVVLAPLAWRDAELASPRTWSAALPAALFLLLSLDEGGQVHERIGWAYETWSGGAAGLLTGPWLALCVPVYAVLAWAAYRSVRTYLWNRPDVLTLLAAGAGLLVLSAAGLEWLGTLLPEGSTERRAVGVFEEGGEMIAGTTLLWGALRLVQLEGVRVVLGRANAPSVPRPTTEPVREAEAA